MLQTSRFQLAIRLIPAYALHATLHPYRRDLDEPQAALRIDRIRARNSAAALDAWVQLLIGAYSNRVGAQARRESGRLAIRYIRLMAAMNREFEYRLATGQSVQLASVLSQPLVAECAMDWRRFTAQHSRNPAIIDFLEQRDLIDDYASYVAVTTRDEFGSSADLQLESMRLDSGGYLARLVRLIGEFSELPTTPDVLREFRTLGLAAKLADDFADLATDSAEGRYNLLLTLLAAEPAEHAAVTAALANSERLRPRWWQSNAPRSFGTFSAMYERHYAEIESRSLQVICDLTMLHAARGPRPRQNSRPGQHVTEPPCESWR
ncbi:hypothetical protein [Nocardia sp. CA-119907]|uniref:hypothetical protein n=1 Tax=Nocardia sp. CA-119907 TaxID=3239973 RepID=UPI003D97D77A